jgi:hypothetical protein
MSFVSVTDLHLSTGSLGNFALAATPLNHVSTDLDGQQRHTIYPYMGADESVSSPLPLELTSFAALGEGKDAVISWTTASEQNVAEFVLEASTDNNRFVPAAVVKAAGNSFTPRSYSYRDAGAASRCVVNNTMYYRLSGIDMDGSRAVVAHGSVTFGTSGREMILYPNPGSGIINLSLNAGMTGRVQVDIMDLSGRSVYSRSLNIAKGANEVELEGAELRPGAYLVRISTGSEMKTIRLIRN